MVGRECGPQVGEFGQRDRIVRIDRLRLSAQLSKCEHADARHDEDDETDDTEARSQLRSRVEIVESPPNVCPLRFDLRICLSHRAPPSPEVCLAPTASDLISLS